MPDLADIEKIEQMLRELGETEMGGEVPHDYPELRAERKAPAGTEEEEIEPTEESEEEVITEKPGYLTGEEFEIPPEIPGEEEEEVGEEILDLPEDFDLERLSVEETPSFGPSVKQVEKEEKVEKKPEEKKPPEEEKPVEEVPVEEEIFFEEEAVAGEEIPGERKEAEEEVPPMEVEKASLEEEKSFVVEEEKKEEKVEKEKTEEEIEEEGIELPGIEEIEKEAEEVPLEEEMAELPPEEEFEVEEPRGEPIPEEKAKEEKPEEKEPYGIDIQLSDEDIVLIQAKLKELSPGVASTVRDIIVNLTIPPVKVRQLIELLLQDVPESKIVSFVEETTGKKIPPRRIPPEVVVPPKAGLIQVLKENLAPLMRVSVLALLVVMVMGAIFFIFAWKPIRAGRYYKQGLELIKNARYEEAELNFNKAVSIYERISQYDNFGWEYALSGNYSLAEKKLKAGIEKDPDFKNISLRIHLAKLYNVQKRFNEADRLYTELLNRYPDKYDYVKLKGENLIDWGKVDREKLDKAYTLFDKAYSKNVKNSDPLFKLLYISLLKNDGENIKYQYELLDEFYPDDVDPVVYTTLAKYLIKKGNLEPIRGLLYKVVKEPPYYPPAFYVFSLYYRAINNKKEEERMLRYAIQLEMERELRYPWDSRDYGMISNAYNNLGELYSRMELPGKIAEAINFFKKAIDASPENPKPYFNIAHLYFYKEKNYDKALRYYLKAKNLGYINDEVRYNLGALYFFRGDHYRAYIYWSKLSEEMPDNPYVGFALGTSLLHLGRYEAALGEFIMLADIYDGLVRSLGEIKPWRAYHKRILKEASKVYNNLGVAYQKLFEQTNKPEYQTKALTALYKGGELADIIGIGRGKIQYNINYILHPDILRNMAIDNEISTTYKFESLG